MEGVKRRADLVGRRVNEGGRAIFAVRGGDGGGLVDDAEADVHGELEGMQTGAIDRWVPE